MLFGLPFAAVGIGFLCLSIIPSLWEWQAMQGWQATNAKVLTAELKTNRSDDGTTWEATARYQYSYNNQPYTGTRVGIMSGSDNIGSWHQDHSRQLKKHRNNNSPITIYIDPANPSESIIDRNLRWSMLAFKSVFALIFGGVGIGLMIFGIRSKTAENPEKLSTDEPWLANKDWGNPIKSNAKMGVWGLWGFAVFWSLMSTPVLFILPDEIANKNYTALIAVIFPIIGIILLITASISTARWRRFGPAPLTLSPYPAAIGGQAAGTLTLQTRLPTDASVKITLCCVRSYYSGTGKDRKRRESIIWSKDGEGEVKHLHQGSQIQFCFNIPEGLPHSELSSDNYHLWRLTVEAKLSGADLNRSFEIPAFQSSAQSRLNIRDSSQHPNAKNNREAELENLLNPTTIPGGIEINLQPLRNAKACAAAIAFGLIFFGVGVALVNSDAPVFMAIIFSVIGAAVVLSGLYSLLNSYQVQITRSGIKATRRLLGYTLSRKSVARSQVTTLRIRKTSSSQSGNRHTEYFAVEAALSNGRPIRVAESIIGRTLAEETLESIALLSGYPKD